MWISVQQGHGKSSKTEAGDFLTLTEYILSQLGCINWDENHGSRVILVHPLNPFGAMI